MKKSDRRLKVFLCHSSTDKAAVRELRDRLKSNGFEPWLDEDNLLPGQNWEAEIRQAVRHSDVVLACISRTSVNKEGYVQKELKYALDIADEKPENTIFLIPVLLERTKVPERLAHLQYCDLQKPNSHERLFRALRARAAIDSDSCGGAERVAEKEAHNETLILEKGNIDYQYDGSAYGATGEIRQPIRHVIPTQAATVLSLGGGRGKDRVEKFRLSEILAFGAATVDVSGAYNKQTRTWETTVTSIIENLEIAHVFTAERLVARLQTRQHADESLPTFCAAGTVFENVRITGYPVNVQLNSPSRTHFESYEACVQRYAGAIRFLDRGATAKPAEGLHTSLVSRIDSRMRIAQKVIGVVTVPMVATFRLAELTITPGRQSLTMLRATLNSEEITGEFTIAGVNAGGHLL